MALSIDGISIFTSPEFIHVKSVPALKTLSSAVVGGGFRSVRHIVNFHVEKNYHCANPGADLRTRARQQQVDSPFVGLLTAADMRKARIVFYQADGLTAGAVVTAGISNAACAGLTPPYSYKVGTINIILLLDACLSRNAMLNAVITATEAKCAVLQSMKILTPSGDPATGTSTDTVTIAATDRGVLQSYAGPATTVGWLIARAVRSALQASLTAS